VPDMVAQVMSVVSVEHCKLVILLHVTVVEVDEITEVEQIVVEDVDEYIEV